MNYWSDIGLGQFDLFYLRTKEKEEVDFLIIKERKPWILLEVKSSVKQSLSPTLANFQKKLNSPYAFQLAYNLPSTDLALDWLDKTMILNSMKSQPTKIIPVSSFLSMFV